MTSSATNGGNQRSIKPGEYLRRKMAAMGLTATSLAGELGVHAQTIYNVTAGKRPISAKLARALAKRFVEPISVWQAEELSVDITEDARFALSEKRSKQAITQSSIGSSPLFAKYNEWDLMPDGTFVDQQIEQLLSQKGTGVKITPYDAEQVQPASYDLTIGLVITSGFRALSEHDWVGVMRHEHDDPTLSPKEQRDIGELLQTKGKEISYSSRTELAPMGSAVIMARELVSFDKRHIGTVGGTARNAIKGLLINHGFQIDPGYEGPIFVTALNIGQDNLSVGPEDKLVSLSIGRLSRPPEQAYQNEILKRITSIGSRLDRQLRNLFDYTELNGGERIKASCHALGLTEIGDNQDEAENKATLKILSHLRHTKGENSAVVVAVLNAMEHVVLDRNDAKALIRHFQVSDLEHRSEALSHFTHKGDEQTLKDTIDRLGINMTECAIILMEID